MLSANQAQLLEAKFENECGSWFEIEPGPRRGGGGRGTLVNFYRVCTAGLSTYSVANYRHHCNHV